MPREKKQHLKQRPDGWYVCRYKDQWFWSNISDQDALDQRAEYKRLEKLQLTSVPTVKEYSEKWLDRAYPTVTKSTKDGLKIHLRKLTDAIGEKLITEVKPSDIKDIYSTRYVGLSKSYIDGARQLYCSMFDAVVSDGYIRSNPAREKPAKPHKGTIGSHRNITPVEREWIDTLCHDHRAWPAVMVMLYAGLRPQEMKALVIDRDVDFEREIITVQETAHLNGREYKFTEEMKTDFSSRQVPLLPPLKEALKGRKGPIITAPDGSAVTVDSWNVTWRSYCHCMESAINGMPKRWYRNTKEHHKILREAEKLRKEGKTKEAEAKEGEIPPWIEFTVVPYDLRTSFCCMCRDLEPPIEIKTVITWMGHADEKMILRIYDDAKNRSEKEAERLKKSLIRSGNGSGEKK